MRRFRFALALSIVGASACSLLLDTDKLQKGAGGVGGAGGTAGAGGTSGTGGAAGTGGAGGSAGDVDAGRDAGASCNSDLDCQPVESVDGCIRHECATDTKTCLPPRAHSGLAVVSVGDAEDADRADDIGYPSLLADANDLVLSFWKRNGTATTIVLRRYDERPGVLPQTADLNAIAPGTFESVASSPGLIARNLPRRIRLFAAAKPVGVAATGMYQMDIDLPSLRRSAMQPRAEIGVAGFDANPRGPVPRLLPNPVLGEPVGMWIQQNRLFYFDGNNMGEVFSTKRVIGFSPLAAGAGIHAALETTDLGSTDDQGQTELWTRGSPALAALIGDQPGARRRGVATTATGEGGVPINFVVWSFERAAGSPTLLYAAAACDANTCSGFGTPPTGADPTLPATGPAAASSRVMGTMTDRDLAVAYQIVAPDPMRPGMNYNVLIAGVQRITTTVDAGVPNVSGSPMNPPSFVVALSNVLPANFGPISVATMPSGTTMVAWVERIQNQATIKTRRFQVRTCP
jgi:hypothetical protein